MSSYIEDFVDIPKPMTQKQTKNDTNIDLIHILIR